LIDIVMAAGVPEVAIDLGSCICPRPLLDHVNVNIDMRPNLEMLMVSLSAMNITLSGTPTKLKALAMWSTYPQITTSCPAGGFQALVSATLYNVPISILEDAPKLRHVSLGANPLTPPPVPMVGLWCNVGDIRFTRSPYYIPSLPPRHPLTLRLLATNHFQYCGLSTPATHVVLGHPPSWECNWRNCVLSTTAVSLELDLLAERAVEVSNEVGWAYQYMAKVTHI
jgi:hypothetical protein